MRHMNGAPKCQGALHGVAAEMFWTVRDVMLKAEMESAGRKTSAYYFGSIRRSHITGLGGKGSDLPSMLFANMKFVSW